MTLLLDTSAVIGLIERRSPAVRALLESSDDDPLVSVLTIAELEHGVQAGSTPAVTELRRRTLTVASLFEIAPLDDVLGPRCYGLVSSQVAGRRIGVIDRSILATAALRDCTLVTENRELADGASNVDWRSHAWEPPVIELVHPTDPTGF